jgi:hypothetical protein
MPWRMRTSGGEETIVRTASGRLQLRLAPPERMTAQAWDLFLDELADSNNLRHAAAAAGVAHSSVIARARGDRAAARGIAGARAQAAKRIRRMPRSGLDVNGPYWPPGLSVDQALRTLARLESKARRRAAQYEVSAALCLKDAPS